MSIADNRESAVDYAIKLNTTPNQRNFFQDENINILNQKRIKLENGLRMKNTIINNVLKHDVKTVNLVTDLAVSNGSQNLVTAQNPIEQVLVRPVFCTAILIASKKVVTIKSSWIKDFSIVKSCNKGLKSTNVHIVFYCSDINAEPDFNMSIAADFNQNQPAMYAANIHKFFGECPKNKLSLTYVSTHRYFKFILLETFDLADAHKNRKRSVIPGRYSAETQDDKVASLKAKIIKLEIFDRDKESALEKLVVDLSESNIGVAHDPIGQMPIVVPNESEMNDVQMHGRSTDVADKSDKTNEQTNGNSGDDFVMSNENNQEANGEPGNTADLSGPSDPVQNGINSMLTDELAGHLNKFDQNVSMSFL